MKISLFSKKDCQACEAARDKILYFSQKWGKRESTSIEIFDVETPDGLAEGAYRDVYDIPTIIFEDQGKEIARWVKKVPQSEEFKQFFFQESTDGEIRDKGIH